MLNDSVLTAWVHEDRRELFFYFFLFWQFSGKDTVTTPRCGTERVLGPVSLFNLGLVCQ